MFGPAGVLYVYFVFGMHWCMNVTAGHEGEAAAVLLRAGAGRSGESTLARARRGPVADRELARGPARLSVALGIDGSANRTSLLDGTGPARLFPPPAPVPAGPDQIRSAGGRGRRARPALALLARRRPVREPLPPPHSRAAAAATTPPVHRRWPI